MIYHSPEPEIWVPDVPLVDHVLARAREFGDKVALVDAMSSERLTYRELVEGVEAASGALARLGVRPGQVVAVMSHNQPRYPVAVHAALAAGAAVTPVNPVLTAGELIKQLAGSQARALITSEEAAAKAAEAADAAGIELRFVLGEAEGFRSFSELTGSGAARPRVTVDPTTAIAALPFSSGD